MKRFRLKRRQLLTSVFWLGLFSGPISACVGTLPQVKPSSPSSPKQQSQLSGEVSIPATFQITMDGSTEAEDFQSLPAVLELSAPQPGDSNPLLIALYMEDELVVDPVNGSFFWQSSMPGQTEHFSQVTVNGNQIQLQVSPSDDALRTDVMWFTEITGTLSELMPDSDSVRSAAMPTTGTMTITIEGDRVTGNMQLSGITDLGASSTYEARFTGQRQ